MINLRKSGPWAMAALAMAAVEAPAYHARSAWPSGPIEVVLHLDAPGHSKSFPSGGLSDGSPDWNSAVAPALALWNEHLSRSTLTVSTRESLSASIGDAENNLFFSDTIYGESFGPNVLAVSMMRTAGLTQLQMVEADIIFNRAHAWDSYRGTRRFNVHDIQRTALHEVGHLLGLHHPDEATPPQNVAAIMNSQLSNTYLLQQDDIDGAVALYGKPITVPVITQHPQSRSVAVGGDATVAIQLNGAPAPPPNLLLKYAWVMEPASGGVEYLFTYPDGEIPLRAAQLTDAGHYRVFVETPDGIVSSSTATINVTPVSTSATTRLAAISTRGFADRGEDALIVGFTIGGSGTRRVLVRGIGPALSDDRFNVGDAMADPVLTLHGQAGHVLATNENWDDPPDAAALAEAFAQSGAFSLPAGAGDAALIVELEPGSYTALVQPSTGSGGTALVEVYDLSPPSGLNDRFLALSTRGSVGNGAGVLIAGIAITGPGPRTYLLRAAGDSLGPMGVTNYLDDPVITLFSGSNRLRWVDDWDSPGFLQPILSAAFSEVSAFSFIDRQESAMLVTLHPGLYTLVVSGFDNSSGIALVEAYEMPEP